MDSKLQFKNYWIWFNLSLDTVAVAELLIKNGASMSITDNYGDIPLGWTYRGKWNLNIINTNKLWLINKKLSYL